MTEQVFSAQDVFTCLPIDAPHYFGAAGVPQVRSEFTRSRRWRCNNRAFSLVIAQLMAIFLFQPAAGQEGPQREATPRRSVALQIADNVLLYQRDTGGWPKNYDREQVLTEEQRQRVIAAKSNLDSTIDNGATHKEIRILAAAYNATNEEQFKEAALRGIRFLLEAQYDNGGWPQSFPRARGYTRYITFNDNAMIGVMSLLRDISGNRKVFSFVPADIIERCQRAVERGIACILKSQIQVNGRLTVWCAQHDEVTLRPQKARSYELASLSGSESVGIVRFLMQVEDPSEEVVQSILSAVGWFQRSQLKGIKVVRVEQRTMPGGFDRVVVRDPDAPPMWARFYDIDTNQPIFCSRDGVPQKSLADISHERRNGYSWLGSYAQALLTKDLPAWKQQFKFRKTFDHR